MAQSFNLEIRASGLMVYSADSIGLRSDPVGPGQRSFPALNITVNESSSGNQDVTKHAHGTETITVGNTSTITFASIVDGVGNTLSWASGIKWGVVSIRDPDGLKECTIGPQTDANAFTFGVAGTTTAALGKKAFKWFELFANPTGLAAGTKLLLTNSGTGTITVDWWLVGK